MAAQGNRLICIFFHSPFVSSFCSLPSLHITIDVFHSPHLPRFVSPATRQLVHLFTSYILSLQAYHCTYIHTHLLIFFNCIVRAPRLALTITRLFTIKLLYSNLAYLREIAPKDPKTSCMESAGGRSEREWQLAFAWLHEVRCSCPFVAGQECGDGIEGKAVRVHSSASLCLCLAAVLPAGCSVSLPLLGYARRQRSKPG